MSVHEDVRPFDLAPLGWGERHEAELAALPVTGCRPGRVARTDRGLCTVLTAAGPVRARPGRVLRRTRLDPAVGDWAVVRDDPDGALVEALLERRSAFVRAAAGGETEAQVVAANVDVALIVSSLQVELNLRRLERYLALAWQSGAEPVLLLTKADLCDDVPAAVAAVSSIAFGVPVHALSAVSGEGVEQVAAYARPARTLVLVGPSGVGKSTLANLLRGDELLATRETRDDGKGRHTTTHRELLTLPGGGVLIDTPGMRELSLWDADEGLARTFDDVEELASSCRFPDCAHAGEPGCAIAAALADGSLDPARLRSYRKLQAELRSLDVRRDKRLQSEARRRWARVNQDTRQRLRMEGRDPHRRGR